MSKTVMVVDDSRFISEEIRYLLTGSDYEMVCYCPDGETAVEMYGKFHPDLVSMDIILPGMDGIDATNLIMQEHPGARVVITSSLAFDDTMEEARKTGAVGFLTKPFEREQLLACFDEAMEKKPGE